MSTDLVESAVRYYFVGMRDVMHARRVEFVPWNKLTREFGKRFIDSPLTEMDPRHTALLALCLRKLKETGAVESISSQFVPPFVRLIEGSSESANSYAREVDEKLSTLGQSRDSWLIHSISNRPTKLNRQEVESYYNRELNIRDESTQYNTDDAFGFEKDEWQPLPIDRDSELYKEAMEAATAALREIESSNGYAVDSPDERSAIVATVKGNLEAVKVGSPNRQSVVHGLLKPLQYIAKKFVDSTLGEIAKLAAVKLIVWLSSLS